MHTKLVSWLQYVIILSHPSISLVWTAFGSLQITIIVRFLHWCLLSWFGQRRLLQSTLAFGVATLSICVVVSMVESMAVLLVVDHIDVIILLLLMKRLSETNKILKQWVHRQLCNMTPFLHGALVEMKMLTLVVLLLDEWIIGHHLLVIRNLSEVAFTDHIRISWHLVSHHVAWSWSRTFRCLGLRIWGITERTGAWFRTRLTLQFYVGLEVFWRVFELALHNFHLNSAKIITISFYGIIVMKYVSTMFFIRRYKIV